TAVNSADILDNDGNQITEQHTTARQTRRDDGRSQALDSTLILNIGHTILNGGDNGGVGVGILEASTGSTLEIHDSVTNAATSQIETNGGTVDFKSGTTIVVANANTTNGIVVDANGILHLFFGCFGHPRALHSFPTRRSSDLTAVNSADILDNDGNQ